MSMREIMARAMRPRDGVTGLAVNALEDGAAEVVVYQEIGFWGITAEDFRRELQAIEADVIHVRIDSPGGDVFQARAMKTTLEQHAARVIVHVDGLAASAASYLMLGGDEIEIAKGAFVMVHNAWTITLGDKREHEKGARLLSQIDATIVADYVARSDKSEADWVAMMDAETWIEAAEAVEMGLCDRVYDRDGGANNRFDLSIFENPPAALVAGGGGGRDDAPDLAAAAELQAAALRRCDYFDAVRP